MPSSNCHPMSRVYVYVSVRVCACVSWTNQQHKYSVNAHMRAPRRRGSCALGGHRDPAICCNQTLSGGLTHAHRIHGKFSHRHTQCSRQVTRRHAHAVLRAHSIHAHTRTHSIHTRTHTVFTHAHTQYSRQVHTHTPTHYSHTHTHVIHGKFTNTHLRHTLTKYTRVVLKTDTHTHTHT